MFEGNEAYKYWCENRPVSDTKYEKSGRNITLEEIKQICAENDNFLDVIKAVQEIQYYPSRILLETTINSQVGLTLNYPGCYYLEYDVKDKDGLDAEVTISFGYVSYGYNDSEKPHGNLFKDLEIDEIKHSLIVEYYFDTTTRK